MKVMLTFLISIFGCFWVSLPTTPWVRFLYLLLATVWASIKQVTKPGPCSFLHVFSRLAVPILCISNASVTWLAAHLHLHHDHLSDFQMSWARTDLLELHDKWPVLWYPLPSSGEILDGGESIYWEYGEVQWGWTQVGSSKTYNL